MYTVYPNNKNEVSDIATPKPYLAEINKDNIDEFLNNQSRISGKIPKPNNPTYANKQNIPVAEGFLKDNIKKPAFVTNTEQNFLNSVIKKENESANQALKNNPTKPINTPINATTTTQNFEDKRQIISSILEPVILNSTLDSKAKNQNHSENPDVSGLNVIPPSMLNTNDDEENIDILDQLDYQDVSGLKVMPPSMLNTNGDEENIDILDQLDYQTKYKQQENLNSTDENCDNISNNQQDTINILKQNSPSVFNNTKLQKEFKEFKQNIVNEHYNTDGLQTKALSDPLPFVLPKGFVLPNQVLTEKEILYFFSPNLFKDFEVRGKSMANNHDSNNYSLGNYKNLQKIEEMAKKLKHHVGNLIFPTLKFICILTLYSKVIAKNISSGYEIINTVRYNLGSYLSNNIPSFKKKISPESISVMDVMLEKEASLSVATPSHFPLTFFMRYLYWLTITSFVFLCGTLATIILRQLFL